MKNKYFRKDNIALVLGLLLLVVVVFYGETHRTEPPTMQKEAIEQQESEKVCSADGLECLFVGCNGFY